MRLEYTLKIEIRFELVTSSDPTGIIFSYLYPAAVNFYGAKSSSNYGAYLRCTFTTKFHGCIRTMMSGLSSASFRRSPIIATQILVVFISH